MKRYTSVALVLALIFLVGMGFSYPKKAPEIRFTGLDGKDYRLSAFRGKVVIVNFFASHCPPCMVELKELARLYREYEDQGLVVISLMVDQEGSPLLPQIVKAKGITYPVGLASEEIIQAFGNVYITPTTFIIDKEGQVVKRLVGYAGRKYLEKKIREYLAE